MARQATLPTMEDTSDAELDKQCEKLLETQKEKTVAADRFKSAHEKLLSMMAEKKLTVYKHIDSGKLFQREATEKVKHKNLKEKVEKNGINPGGTTDEDDLGEVTGQSEVLDALEEINDEGPEGDDLKPKKRGKGKKK